MTTINWFVIALAVVLVAASFPIYTTIVKAASNPVQQVSKGAKYVVIGWNNLGMHCYNTDFSNLAILPPLLHTYGTGH